MTNHWTCQKQAQSTPRMSQPKQSTGKLLPIETCSLVSISWWTLPLVFMRGRDLFRSKWPLSRAKASEVSAQWPTCQPWTAHPASYEICEKCAEITSDTWKPDIRVWFCDIFGCFYPTYMYYNTREVLNIWTVMKRTTMINSKRQEIWISIEHKIFSFNLPKIIKARTNNETEAMKTRHSSSITINCELKLTGLLQLEAFSKI